VGPKPNPYKFTSKWHDDPTGMVYLWARQGDPEIGRFASADPVLGSLSRPQTQNRYAYVANNPRAREAGVGGSTRAVRQRARRSDSRTWPLTQRDGYPPRAALNVVVRDRSWSALSYGQLDYRLSPSIPAAAFGAGAS